MAKHCDVCNQSYPETEPRCPHCAAAATEVIDADDVVDLSAPAESVEPAPPSPAPHAGVEPVVAELASGVEEGSDVFQLTAPAGGSESDVDLGEPFVAELAGSSGRIAHTSQTPPAHAGIGDSAIDGEPFVAEIASGVNLVPGATSAVEPGNEPPAAILPEVTEAESSAIDLGTLAAAGTGGVEFVEPSGVHAGGEPVVLTPDSGTSGPDLAALAAEPEVTPELPVVAAEGEPQFLDDLAEVEAGSAVNLGEEARPGERGSSRDLIAEAVESGVDLAGERARAEERVESGAVPAEAGDSAVDLGSAERPALKEASGPEAVPERRSGGRHGAGAGEEEHVDLGAPAEEGEEAATEAEPPAAQSSEIDLGGTTARKRRRKAAGKSSSSHLDLDDVAAEALAGGESGTAAAEAADEEEAVAAPSGLTAAAEEGEEEAEAPARSRRGAVAEEGEEKPAKPPKARGAGCLVGAGVIGLLVGAVIPVGLSVLGVEPWKSAPPKTSAGPGPQVAQKAPPAAAPADAGEQLRHGDFAKAFEIFKAAPETPEVQAQRGTARWLSYLQVQKAKGALIDPNAAEVKEAGQDLKAAADRNDPEALLTLGHMQEWTGARAEALKTYQEGATRFAQKPGWARAFQAQIDRMESAGTAAAPAEGGRPGAAARSLYAALIALQAGETPQPAGPADSDSADEAGFEFWKAVKLARGGDYAGAIKALEAARAAHDKLRFTRLRRAQNPLSDPTEEIFLRSAGEIEAYWRLEQYLEQQKLLARGGDPLKAVQGALGNTAAAQAQLKGAADKLKTTPDRLGAGIDALVKEKDDAAQKATAGATALNIANEEIKAAKAETKSLNGQLAMTGDKLKAAEGRLKAVGDRLAAAGIKEPADPGKGVDQLTAERNAADKTLADVVAKVAGAGVKVDKAHVVEGVEHVVEAAKIKDPRGELVASKQEIKRLDGALAQRHTPQEMLDVWLLVLADRAQKADAEKAVVDAERAAGDPGATPAVKGKAMAVQGLARRNQGNYPAAESLLLNGLMLAGDKGDWQPAARQSLKELTDPNAYYLPRARALYEAGKYDEALAVLEEARKVFPREPAPMFPLRSLVRLELALAKGKGKLDPNDPLVKGAKEEAEAVAAAGKAEGWYRMGQIAEALGDLSGAKTNYAKAVAAHPGKDDDGSRYRTALARVLLKTQGEQPAGGRAAASLRDPLAALVLLVRLGAQADANPNREEATRLADEVLASPDGPDSFLYKAQALAVKGLWAKALQTYAAGLKGHVRPDYADVLTDLINGHPALRRPDSLAVPNPVLAETYYASGLRAYFARRYADAETAFLAAIEADNQDARYFYFLGLSRMALNKRDDANADFEAGAKLELEGRPGREAVSTALERVQGAQRLTVNRFRP